MPFLISTEIMSCTLAADPMIKQRSMMHGMQAAMLSNLHMPGYCGNWLAPEQSLFVNRCFFVVSVARHVAYVLAGVVVSQFTCCGPGFGETQGLQN